MVEEPASIRRFYSDWTQYRSRLVEGVRDISQMHTRRSILLRLLSHDAFHSGEISQLLGVNGLPAIDLWARRPRA